jgi:AraC-like DNA-binding protein
VATDPSAGPPSSAASRLAEGQLLEDSALIACQGFGYDFTIFVRPRGQSLSDRSVPHIDCFGMHFPETDAASLAAYRKMMRPVFEFEIPISAKKVPFWSEAEIFCLPDVTVSRTKSSGGRFTRTFTTIAQSPNDQILVVCYTSGHFTLAAGGTSRRVNKGELAFIDLSQEIVIEAPAVENVSLAISRHKLEALFPLLEISHGLALPPGALTRVLLGIMEDSMAIGPAMTQVEARPIGDAIIRIVAACLENLSRQHVAANAVGSSASLVAMKAAIERRLTEPTLGPKMLLDEFGITRSTLYRAFEPFGGVSAYIMERRLRYAFRRMTDPLQPRPRISQLAFEFGFSHPPAFTRAFKTYFGLAPKNVRALAVRPELSNVPFMASPEALAYVRPIKPG